MSYAAYPLAGLLAGVFIDRVRRRPVMVVADGSRLLAFGTIPVAAAIAHVTLTQLYLVAGIAAVFAVLFDVANQAHLATLVPARDLPAGNAGLELSRSIAQMAGPVCGGLLVQLAGAVGAIAVNATSFLASVAGVVRIRAEEPVPVPNVQGLTIGQQLAQGWSTVFGSPLLRPMVIAAAIRNLGMVMVKTILLLYMYRALHLSAGEAGTILGIGATAAVVGATCATRFGARCGPGRTLVISSGAEGLLWTLAPLSLLAMPTVVLVLVAAVASPWLPIWNANVLGIRQQVTPIGLQARVHATARTINWSTLPLGALLAGVLATACAQGLGDRAGLALALTTSAAVAAGSSLAILSTSVRRLSVQDVLVATDSAQRYAAANDIRLRPESAIKAVR